MNCSTLSYVLHANQEDDDDAQQHSIHGPQKAPHEMEEEETGPNFVQANSLKIVSSVEQPVHQSYSSQ